MHSSPDASIYHLSAWMGIIQDIFGHQQHALYATVDNKMLGILPSIQLKSYLFGDYMVSMPYFNYGGAIGATKEIKSALIQSAGEISHKLGVSHVEFRDIAPHPDLPTKLDKITMELTLPETEDELWKGFSKKLRAQIKRPERENILIQTGSLDQLNAFYAIFSRNMRDLGTPVYPKSFFAAILDTFPENTSIITVSHQNRPVAAGFLIGYKSRLEIPWASSLRKYNRISVNMALYWAALKFAIKSNYKVFDFGRCGKNSGTYKFKKQWGAEEKQLYWHYWLNKGDQLPALNPNNPKYQLAIKTWKKLPLGLANWLGPKLVKNLP